jgi:hypothetical protein
MERMMAEKIQCAKCGLPLMGRWQIDANGKGPCEAGADSPRYCDTLANRWFSANDQSLVQGGFVTPAKKAETISGVTAMLDAANIPQETRDYWLSHVQARRDANAELRRLWLADSEKLSWLQELNSWLDSGPFDARFLELIAAIQIMPNASESMTFGEVSEWHSELARRAAEIISDVNGYGD